MKRILLLVLLVLSSGAYAQDSTRLGGYSVIVGVGFGPGFVNGTGQYNRGYDDLFFVHNGYADFRSDVGILWKERMGVRISVGRQGWRDGTYAFYEYSQENYPGFKLLFEYSDIYSGYAYSAITPQFMYRIGKEPFNVTLAGGFGIGQLCSPHGHAEMQETGSNNFMEITFSSPKVWNYNGTAGFDLAYVRQASQHLFYSFGLYASCNIVFLDYGYTYTEQYYNQPVSVNESYSVKQTIGQINAGVFLNFQWNSEESARAFYY